MSIPLVSIIIPIYNCQDWLEETIISAKNQTWQNKEIILVDDGSNDRSLEIAQKYACHWIKVFSQENKGASAARNYGLREAKGDYIQFLDGDDLLDASKIEIQLNEIISNKNNIACGSCIHFFGLDGEFKQYHEFLDGFSTIEKPLVFIKKLYGGFSDIPPSMVEIHSWLVHISIIEKTGWWNEQLSVDDDGEYFLRILLNVETVFYLPNAITFYRKRKSTNSLAGQILKRKGFKSSLNALDNKLEFLKPYYSREEINTIFAKFYWEKALFAYPKYLFYYRYCSKMAKELKYKGPKFLGSANASRFTHILGWRFVRILQHLVRFLN